MLAWDYSDNEDPGLNGIYVRPSTGGGPGVRLTSGPERGFDTNTDFSPDGEQVVFQRLQFNECLQPNGCGLRDSTGFRVSIWVVNTDGSDLHRITPGGQLWSDPHYSPDGSRILIQSYDDHLEIQVMDADGSNPETVAACDPDRFCDFPSWGAYDGPLPAAAVAQARTGVSASAAGSRAHRVRRLRRAVRRELAGRSRAASKRAPRRAW
jgi:dipeptidyl aminopeptidase/acylaminoacyl peptidase